MHSSRICTVYFSGCLYGGGGGALPLGLGVSASGSGGGVVSTSGFRVCLPLHLEVFASRSEGCQPLGRGGVYHTPWPHTHTHTHTYPLHLLDTPLTNPLWTEWLTDRCKTVPCHKLRLRAVMNYWRLILKIWLNTMLSDLTDQDKKTRFPDRTTQVHISIPQT